MARTPEGKVKDEVKRILNTGGAAMWYFMPVQTGRGKKTIDFIGFFHGQGFGIETKAPGERPTEYQDDDIRLMQDAKCTVFVIDGTDDYPYSNLERWMKQVNSIQASLVKYPQHYRAPVKKLIELTGR